MFEPLPTDASDQRVRFTRLPFGQLQGADFELAHRLWQQKRGARRLPARADFDPLELKPALTRIMLIEVSRDPPDFRYRLAGTLSREVTGMELTGRSVLQMKPAKQGRLLWNDLCEIVTTREPQLARLDVQSQFGTKLSYTVLRLPLATDGENVDMVLIVQSYGDSLPLLREYYDDFTAEEAAGKGRPA